MLEIDIDVRWFVTFNRNETLEKHFHQSGIHIGDAETIADHRICGGAASLTEDLYVVRPGEANDVVDRQEIARVFLVADNREFVPDEPLDLFGNAGGIAFLAPFPGQPFQFLCGCRPYSRRLFRIIVLELVQRKLRLSAKRSVSANPSDSGETAAPSRSPASNTARHWRRARSRLGDRNFEADGGQHVL